MAIYSTSSDAWDEHAKEYYKVEAIISTACRLLLLVVRTTLGEVWEGNKAQATRLRQQQWSQY